MTLKGRNIPSETEVLEYFSALCNWGRWGDEDQIGTLNHITPNKRVRALNLATQGISVSCARPIEKGVASDVTNPPLHMMLRSGEKWVQDGNEDEVQSASDFIGLAPHGFTITHIDALSHIFWKGKMYGGKPASSVTTQDGATVEAVTVIKDGIVTRGVLLDITKVRGKQWLEASEPVFVEDLEEAEKIQGVQIEEGDALLLRLGWYKRRNQIGPPSGPNRPGLHVSALPWIRDRGVALLASDASHDVFPSGYPKLALPVHQIGITAMGLWLLDAANFEDVVPLCESLRRWSFAFVVSALRFTGATASPVNPLAIF